jgi:hypothetical protein
VFENRVLRRIFGPKREEVITDWRRLHTEELRNLHALPSIVRVMKTEGHVARMEEIRNACNILVRKK